MQQDPQRDDVTTDRLVDYAILIKQQAEWLRRVVTDEGLTMVRSEALQQLEQYVIAMGKEILDYNRAHRKQEPQALRAGSIRGGAKRRKES